MPRLMGWRTRVGSLANGQYRVGVAWHVKWVKVVVVTEDEVLLIPVLRWWVVGIKKLRWVVWGLHVLSTHAQYTVGMGTVLIFDTPWHTTYPCCGITGTHRFIVVRLSLFFYVLNYFFDHLLPLFFTVSHCDRTKYGCASHALSLSLLPHCRWVQLTKVTINFFYRYIETKIER